MPQNVDKLRNIDYNFGDLLFEWEVPEFEEQSRGIVWYMLMFAITIILLGISVWTGNFLFALIIILAIFIVFLKSYSPNRNLKFKIYDRGLMLGKEFYEFKDVESFYIIYDPPVVKKLYFVVKGFGPDLSLPLNDMNPLVVRKKLLDYLEEDLDKEDETLDDHLNKFLKL